MDYEVIKMPKGLYDDIKENMQNALIDYQDAMNLLKLFPWAENVGELTVDVGMRLLKPVKRASLSSGLWEPTKVKAAVEKIVQSRYSSGIIEELEYGDWKSLVKQGGIVDATNAHLGEQPAIQQSYYFIQGKRLEDDGTQSDAPNTYYNWLLDVGDNALASTATRPIACNQVTGTPNTFPAQTGNWSTYLNMATDMNALISPLVAKGWSNKNEILVLYPVSAESAMTKKRDTGGGAGLRNAKQELTDQGIPEANIIPVNDIFMYTRAGAAPTNALFDIIAVAKSAVKIFPTMESFINVFFDNSGTKFPWMKVESGLATVPFLIPKYHRGDTKYYKGMTCIRAIVGT